MTAAGAYRDLVDALEAHAARPDGRGIAFRGASALTYTRLWAASDRCGQALEVAGVRPGTVVALSMATAEDAVIAVVALLRLGAVIVPLPASPIGGFDAIVPTLRIAKATWCLVPDRLLATAERALGAGLSGVAVRVEALERCIAGPDERSNTAPPSERWRASPDWPALIQFSSGSTAEPHGIHLTHGNLVANVTAIRARIRGTPDDHTVSWLPLHHDMGLIGILLTSLHVGASVTLMPPTEFVRHPLRWLRMVSECRASVTAGPQFAYALCAAKSEVAADELEGLDLSSLRYAFNGSELVHWPTCRRFEAALAHVGLRPNVVQPAYGLAENCVAVTLRDPDTSVRTRWVSRSALACGRTDDAPPGPTAAELVGNGRPVADTLVEIRAEDGKPVPEDAVGRIHVGGASMAERVTTASGECATLDARGYRETGDLGAVLGGELFIVGRTKEIIKHGGSSYAPTDIERRLETALSLPPNGVVAFGVRDYAAGTEGIALAVEVRHGASADEVAAIQEQVHLAVLRDFRLIAREVLVAVPGAIPRTSSGKLRRAHLSEVYTTGDVERTLRLHPRLARAPAQTE
jgi:fatty-acyl-CoA synthase